MAAARRVALAAVTAAGLAGTWAVAPPAGASGATVPEVQLVVALDHAHAVHAASTLAGLPGSTPAAQVADRYTLRVPAGEVAATLEHLRSQPGVRYATASHRVHAFDVTPNDPCYAAGCGPVLPEVVDPGTGVPTTGGPQDDLRTIGAPRAWSMTQGAPTVTVAVLDTGVDANHQDLIGRVAVGPTYVSGPDPSCAPGIPPARPALPAGDTDDNGHGTHVAGTVAAATGNGLGVASLGGYSVHVVSYKVLDCTGGGSSSDLASAIYDATDRGYRVISMSLGNEACGLPTTYGPVAPPDCGPDPDTQAAVEYAQAHGVVVVAAAGNDGRYGEPYASEPTYPAGYPGVLSVAATDNSGTIASFSQHGPAADIAAPGTNIVSTWTPYRNPSDNAAYAVLSGTSMATPHVAAAAALVESVAPRLSGPEVVSDLETATAPVRGAAIDGGLLDVPAALGAAEADAPYQGYVMAGTDGSAYPFGAAPFLGDLSGMSLNRPVVASATLPERTGYWMAASDGGVFSFGAAAFHGSMGGKPLNRPIVGMAAMPDGRGYWEVASDGGIFAFGTAGFHGSMGGRPLNRPIVGMAVTKSGNGYWLVASDGGIFAFGDAQFYGSMGGSHLNQPVVGMATAPGVSGYWLVASDGGIFSFGAQFYGSTGSIRLVRPIVAMVATAGGAGYRLVASDGGVFAFGDARFEGSTGGQQLPAPIATAA